MTPSEFKAWFEGFTEAMDGRPTERQWDAIKRRVGEIDGRPVTERVFIDCYWPEFRPFGWHPWYTWIHNGSAAALVPHAGSSGVTDLGVPASDNRFVNTTMQVRFDSHAAMAALGRREFSPLD
jgi:hypothetical protein